MTPSKPKRARFSTGAAAVQGVASELREIRRSIAAPINIDSNTGPTSPQRLAKAVKLAEEDEDISDNEKAAMIKLFVQKQGIADSYLAIQGENLRRIYIRSEMM